MKIKLGSNINLDLKKLIDTRLLIQANSGGGKSWAIRKLLEETNGKVQQIVLDIEGDFASLREKFDYIYAAKNGDISISPKVAGILARKVLELRADIICDLYELKQIERIRFVKLFLDEMINAPKELWKPVLVIIDEAHIFAPEKGHAESASSVIDICTRGRKRGYCAVLATQRLSKLHKDAAAECNNKLIGRTGLDIDVKRVADELGMGTKEAITLRDLEPGEFYIFGPALSRRVVKEKIGSVVTKHPEAGSRSIHHTPEPTAKVITILSKLSDLPKDAEHELQDKASMENKIRELTLEVKRLQTQKPKLSDDEIKDLKGVACTRFAEAMHDLRESIYKKIGELDQRFLKSLGIKNPPEIKIKYNLSTVSDEPIKLPPDKTISISAVKVNGSFNKCERSILGFLYAKHPNSFNKVQIGAMTGYSNGSGGFNNALSHLSQSGLIIRQGDQISVPSNELDEIYGIIQQDGNVDYKLDQWISKLRKCERAIYEQLLECPENSFTKDDIADATGYSKGSGGFNNSLSKLSTLGLIQRNLDGTIALNREIVNL